MAQLKQRYKKMAWRVKAIPKAARYRPDSPQAMFSWHKLDTATVDGRKWGALLMPARTDREFEALPEPRKDGAK